MTVPALWPALRRILVSIGRWLLDRLELYIPRGVTLLTAYMRERVEVFRGRLSRARTDRRKRWLRGRIRRWLTAADWLDKWRFEVKQLDFADCQARAAKLPLVSPQEREPRRAAA